MNLKLPFIRWPEPGLVRAASYRVAAPVTAVVRYPACGLCCPVCPRCGRSLEREYVSFCDRCGQKLGWDRIDRARILLAPVRK